MLFHILNAKKEILDSHNYATMTVNQDIETFTQIIEKNGRAIMDRAILQVLNADYDAGKVSKAAKHHTTFLRKVAPVFPALVNLSSQAVGGKYLNPTGVGAALTLFVEASNIHDDIIDETALKHNRKTSYGRFGINISILAGDILLVQAAFSLYKECESLPMAKKDKVVQLTFKALTEIIKSEAQESLMHRRLDVTPRDYLEVIKLRAAVLEAHCMIGAILGGANDDLIANLGLYGRTYGIVGTIIDEIFDIVDYEKFSARLSKECLPLPVLCAIHESELKEKIIPLLKDSKVNYDDYNKIVGFALSSKSFKKIREEQIASVNIALQQLKSLPENDAVRDLSILLIILRGLICNLEEFTSRSLG